MCRIAVVFLLAAVAALAGPRAASAVTWTEVPSGTTEEITAIEYQGADRFWFTTGNGKIFRRVGGAFGQVASVPGVVLRDIQFQEGGDVGFAVGTNGTVLRSANAGATWSPVGGIVGGRQLDVNNCTGVNQALGDIDSVRFAGPARVWLMAGGSQLFRTVDGANATNVGAAAGGWTWINDDGATCRVPTDTDDAFPVPGSDSVYFVGRSFGNIHFSSNALASAASEKAADAGNGFTSLRRMAGDPGNPNRMWAVTSSGEGGSYYARTDDGWSTSDGWSIGNPDRGSLTRGEDVDAAGGTVVAAGSAGMIVVSVDGTTFYFDPAGGPLATNAWRAVGVAGAADAAVGGVGGRLIVASNANVIPDVVAPTGTISGPVTVVAGQPATFTANVADNAGGSGIDPASFAWTATGTPGASGNPATITFGSAGFFTVRVRYADNAGNPAEATLSVSVRAATPPSPPPPPLSPTKTIGVAVPGGSLNLGAPRACVPAGTSFTATLAFKKSTKKVTATRRTVVKVTKVVFTINGRQRKTDRKAPFRQRLTVRNLKAGTKHTLRARATMKVRRGKSPTKSITTKITVCG